MAAAPTEEQLGELGIFDAEDAVREVALREAVAPSSAVSPDVSSQPQRLTVCSAAAMNSDIDRLLAEQKRIKDDKKRVAQDLKNALRRRKRLKHRPRLLSSDDLVRVMALREAENAAKAQRASAASASQSAGSSAGPSPASAGRRDSQEPAA